VLTAYSLPQRYEEMVDYSVTSDILVLASGDQNKPIDRFLICKGRQIFGTCEIHNSRPIETVVLRLLPYVEDVLDTHARALASSVDKRDARHPSGHAKE
jgi:hypothetical protein